VTVRVINDDRESSVMHHALETSRRAGTFFERGCYDVEAVTERESARDRRECVVDVRWTNQRRMKIAFTRGRRESKAHTTQRKLRIASSHVRIAIHRVTNHAQAILFERCGQLDAVRIVYVDDGVTRPRPETTVKQSLLRVPVVLHRLVIVEVIAREICKHGHGVFQFVTTMKVHRLRGTFHYG